LFLKNITRKNKQQQKKKKMKDTSKVIIGVTLVMVITLAFVIALILVLLVELYCSLLLRRHKLKNKNTNTHQTLNNTKTTLTNVSPSHVSNFTNIYSQGVLQAPRNILFPSIEQQQQQQNNLHHQVIPMKPRYSKNGDESCLIRTRYRYSFYTFRYSYRKSID
jgi:flagellar basal body-associated protein FliL